MINFILYTFHFNFKKPNKLSLSPCTEWSSRFPSFLNTLAFFMRPYTTFLYMTLYGSLREGNGNPLQYSRLENPMDGGAWWLQSVGLRRVRHDWVTSLSRIGEGNGNPLQCSCLKNPRDQGAQWAAVYGAAHSWTRLKRLSSSSIQKSVLNTLWKNWCWSWSSSTLATCCEELTHWKDPDAGKDWRQEEKGMTEDEMVGWHHQLDGHEFEQALGVGDGPGSLAYCSPWGHKELDMTEQLNWTDTTWL